MDKEVLRAYRRERYKKRKLADPEWARQKAAKDREWRGRIKQEVRRRREAYESERENSA